MTEQQILNRIEDIGIEIYYLEKEIGNLESERDSLERELSVQRELHGN